MVGAEVEIAAVLERVAGRRLESAVRVRNGGRPVARGGHSVVVDTVASSATPERPGERARVVAEWAVGAPADLVYRLIADFDRHHRFLPPAFSQLGLSKAARHRAQLPEPAGGPGTSGCRSRSRTQGGCDRVRRSLLDCNDLGSDPGGAGLPGPGRYALAGRGRVFERLFASVMRRLDADELGLLDRYARSASPG